LNFDGAKELQTSIADAMLKGILTFRFFTFVQNSAFFALMAASFVATANFR
jgi:hypothetical protein